MEKLKVVLLILVVTIIIGGITGGHFFTDTFPGSDPLNAIEFTDPNVIVTPSRIRCGTIGTSEVSILTADDCSAR